MTHQSFELRLLNFFAMNTSKSALVTRALYRAFLRESRSMKESGKVLHLRDELSLGQWGQGGFVRPEDMVAAEIINRLVPNFGKRLTAASINPKTAAIAEKLWEKLDIDCIDSEQLNLLVRIGFKIGGADEAEEAAIEDGFTGLQQLARQQLINDHTTTTVENGVQVEITTSAVPQQFLNGQPVDTFTYRVRVKNLEDQKVLLVGRRWQISDSDGHTDIVPDSSTVPALRKIDAVCSDT